MASENTFLGLSGDSASPFIRETWGRRQKTQQYINCYVQTIWYNAVIKITEALQHW